MSYCIKISDIVAASKIRDADADSTVCSTMEAPIDSDIIYLYYLHERCMRCMGRLDFLPNQETSIACLHMDRYLSDDIALASRVF